MPGRAGSLFPSPHVLRPITHANADFCRMNLTHSIHSHSIRIVCASRAPRSSDPPVGRVISRVFPYSRDPAPSKWKIKSLNILVHAHSRAYRAGAILCFLASSSASFPAGQRFVTSSALIARKRSHRNNNNSDIILGLVGAAADRFGATATKNGKANILTGLPGLARATQRHRDEQNTEPIRRSESRLIKQVLSSGAASSFPPCDPSIIKAAQEGTPPTYPPVRWATPASIDYS